jgi:hypothetical protein
METTADLQSAINIARKITEGHRDFLRMCERAQGEDDGGVAIERARWAGANEVLEALERFQRFSK